LNRKRKNDRSGVSKASFQVGKVSFLDVPTMTFEEFLMAMGEEAKCDALKRRDWKILGAFHDSSANF
jgi:hypothetical protein